MPAPVARTATSEAASPPPAEGPRLRRARLIMAGALLGMGTLHVVLPRPFDAIIPDWVPGAARAWTYASGVAELAAGALLAGPRTRRLGATLAAATLVAVFPANIQMAIDEPPTSAYGLALLARLPLQIPLVVIAL
ncbi:MAG: hypothetical protein WKF93_05930, partial [Acidimicrobiales bacterium]